MNKEIQLQLDNVSIAYGKVEVVRNMSFCFQKAEIVCLLGPSGCGKSTLLRAIAGFEPIVTGSIKMQSQLLSTPNQQLPPEKRRIGMVFQDIALFPHLSIEDNIGFGIRSWSKDKIKQRVTELLELIGLPGTEQRYPYSLSGGQQQRIALARALAPRPDILLLDEPFSGLDANLRETLVPEMRQILKQEQISAILVSHDHTEAFAMADKIAIMQQGQIEQWGTASELYHRPSSRFVADFMGLGKFLQGYIDKDNSIITSLGKLKFQKAQSYPKDSEVEILIRPDNIQPSMDSSLSGEIIDKRFRGTHYLYHLLLTSGEVLPCITDCFQDYKIGQSLGFCFKLNSPLVFAKKSQ